MAIIKDLDIKGKRVILEDASDVGSIVDIFVETSDWRVTQFAIKLEKRYAERLGLETGLLKKTVIPVKIHFLKSVHDVVHFKGNIDDLAKSQKKVLPPEPKARKKGKGKTPPPPPPKPPTRPTTSRVPPKQDKKPTKL